MNTKLLKTGLAAVGLAGVISAVGAQTYYTHELAERVAARTPASQPVAGPAPAAAARDPWSTVFADMDRMRAQMDRMFNATFPDFPVVGLAPPAGSPVSVDEQDGKYVVRADIPGATEKDIDVNLNGRLLSISSRTTGNEKETSGNGQVIRQEDYASSYQQAFTLPGPVNASGMRTHFKDGVLTVTIPKQVS